MFNVQCFLYLCPNESEFYDCSTNKWLWQDDHCQGTDGAADGVGFQGATVQVRSRLYRHQVP